MDATVWLAPLLGLLGALVGGAVAPFTTARLSQRQDRHAAFDRAISALSWAQAARNVPTGVGSAQLGMADEERCAIDAAMRARSLERFVDAMTEARLRLTELEPFHDTSRYFAEDQWEITEPGAKALIAELRAQRRSRK